MTKDRHLSEPSMAGNAADNIRPWPKRPAVSHLLLRGFRQAVFLALGAALPASALYCYEKLRAVGDTLVQPVAADALWIDARSDEDFAKEHIPGALSLNEKNWERALPRLFETWQPPRSIIVYCSAGCPASAKIAAKLAELGVEPVQVMEGGYEAWKRSNG